MILRHACVLLLMVATPAVLMAQQGPLVTETEPKGDGLGLSDKSEVKTVAPAGRPLPEPWER